MVLNSNQVSNFQREGGGFLVAVLNYSQFRVYLALIASLHAAQASLQTGTTSGFAMMNVSRGREGMQSLNFLPMIS